MNNAINQSYVINIYRTLHTTIAEYIFISGTHKIYTKIDYICMGHSKTE